MDSMRSKEDVEPKGLNSHTMPLDVFSEASSHVEDESSMHELLRAIKLRKKAQDKLRSETRRRANEAQNSLIAAASNFAEDIEPIMKEFDEIQSQITRMTGIAERSIQLAANTDWGQVQEEELRKAQINLAKNVSSGQLEHSCAEEELYKRLERIKGSYDNKKRRIPADLRSTEEHESNALPHALTQLSSLLIRLSRKVETQLGKRKHFREEVNSDD